MKYSSSAELRCSAKTNGPITFIWHQNQFGIEEVNNYAFDNELDNSNVTDTILIFNITDNKHYLCTVISRGYEITSKEAVITVLEVPSKFMC